MSLADLSTRVVERYGSPYTIRKPGRAAGANSWTAGTETPTYSECRGRERFYRPSELGEGIQEGDALLTVDALTCPVKPAKGDKVAAGAHENDLGVSWGTVVNVYAPAVVGGVMLYKMQVRY